MALIYDPSLQTHTRSYKNWILQSAKWQLRTVDDKGQSLVAILPYIEFDSNGYFKSSAPHKEDGYKDLEGSISKEGIADFKFKLLDGLIMECTGKLAGQNRIVGNWTIRNQSFGQFELAMLDAVPYQLTRTSTGGTFTDYYYLNLSKSKPRIQGVGVNDSGVYVIIGKLKEKKIKLYIYYLGKFCMKIKGKHDPKSGVIIVNGRWKNYAKGNGECTLCPLQPGFIVPHPGIYVPPPQPTPFNPLPVQEVQTFQPHPYPNMTEISGRQESPAQMDLHPFNDHREHAKVN